MTEAFWWTLESQFYRYLHTVRLKMVLALVPMCHILGTTILQGATSQWKGSIIGLIHLQQWLDRISVAESHSCNTHHCEWFSSWPWPGQIQDFVNRGSNFEEPKVRQSWVIRGHAPLWKYFEIWNVWETIFRSFRVHFRQCKCEPAKKGGSTEPLKSPLPVPPTPPDPPQPAVWIQFGCLNSELQKLIDKNVG